MTKNATYFIAYGCPKIDRDKDCPFSDIEHLSFLEKINWIDELDDEKKKNILKHHSYCTKKK